MKRWPLWVILATVCWLSPSHARGEVLLLTNGGRVEGDLVNRDESPRKTYILQTPLGVQLTLTKSQVERVIVLKDADKQYEVEVRKMPDTVAGHLDMAEWCRVNDLRPKRQYHLEQVIEREPNHAAARAALGYNKTETGWMKTDEFMKSQGYVRHKSAWRVRQEVEREIAAKKFTDEVVAAKKKLRLQRTRYEKRSDAGALAEMRGAEGLAASVAFAEMLATEELRELKLLYIEMLGNIPSPAGVSALIRHSLNDRDESIRDACFRELKKHGAPQATAAYLVALSGKDNALINRAGDGLGRLGQEEVVLPLIDALVTQHKSVSSSGQSITPTFSGGGAGGLSAGSKTTVIVRNVANESVLGALRAITGQDFLYDVQRWRDWYIDSRTPKNVNLRRREQ